MDKDLWIREEGPQRGLLTLLGLLYYATHSPINPLKLKFKTIKLKNRLITSITNKKD